METYPKYREDLGGEELKILLATVMGEQWAVFSCQILYAQGPLAKLGSRVRSYLPPNGLWTIAEALHLAEGSVVVVSTP